MPEPIDVVEALLFASDTPVEAERIQEVLDLESASVARELELATPGWLITWPSSCQLKP